MIKKTKQLQQQDYIVKFLNAFGNEKARSFVQSTMIEHYVEAIIFHYPGSFPLSKVEITDKVTSLVEAIFSEILKLVRYPNKLHSELLRLGRKRQDRVPEWFSEFDEAYDHYKKKSKLPFIASFIQPFIEGTSSLLDFGCGDGEIASYLAKQAGLHSVSGIDVMDWRHEQYKNTASFIFFQHDFSLEASETIPQHETGLMHAMLHHVSNDPEELTAYVRHSKSVISKQLLVIEDVVFDKNKQYSNIPGIESLEAAKQAQPNFKKYLSLEIQDQKDVITILDLLSNSLAMGIPDMNFPFGAQELSTWLKIFVDAGLKLKTIKVLGFQDHLFHRMSQVLFVLEI